MLAELMKVMMLPPLCITASSFIGSLGRQLSHFADEAIWVKGEELPLSTFMHWRRKWQPLQCSCLENPRDEGAQWTAIYGVTQSRT